MLARISAFSMLTPTPEPIIPPAFSVDDVMEMPSSLNSVLVLISSNAIEYLYGSS
ncbi:hypothetical protein IKA92_06505 [bacterium]|nr:hypothetical protein [bacterium]